MIDRLHDLVLDRDELAVLDPAQRRLELRSLVAQSAGSAALPALVGELADLIDGLGPLTDTMRDDLVTDVLVNGPHEIWVERAGSLEPVASSFADACDLRAFIDRVFGAAGVRVDESRPIADARLPDGSRINVVLPPIAPDGPLVSIRRFPPMRFTLADLVDAAMLSPGDAEVLARAVSDRRTMAISGGTGSGKTTLLNALLGLVEADERIVLIEETPELQPPCRHYVSLVARPANIEGRGAVELADLVRASLRMRPSRIIVGEIRGAEALAALSAMATGHEGSMVTVHARSAPDALQRVLTLALQGNSGATETSLRRRIDQTFDLVIHLERQNGVRTVAEMISPQ
jgi:pilus assembly protein CpaF